MFYCVVLLAMRLRIEVVVLIYVHPKFKAKQTRS